MPLVIGQCGIHGRLIGLSDWRISSPAVCAIMCLVGSSSAAIIFLLVPDHGYRGRELMWCVGFGAGPLAACRPRITLRLPGCDRRADHVAGDHQLHPPILLPALRCCIGSHWLSLAKALRRD